MPYVRRTTYRPARRYTRPRRPVRGRQTLSVRRRVGVRSYRRR